MPKGPEILSIGHSTHSYEEFRSWLQAFEVSAIADVRSSPVSTRYPHFNWEDLKSALRNDGIAYSFLGKELGGRPRESSLYTDGVADYEKMAGRPLFQSGVQRLKEGSSHYRIALLCSEFHPAECHRCVLVGRSLLVHEVDTEHIVGLERSILQSTVEAELLSTANLSEKDMFLSQEEQVAQAYRQQAQKIAYSKTSSPNDAVRHG